MKSSFINYPFLLIPIIGLILSCSSFAQIDSVTSGEQLLTELKISTFDIDATPPVGSYLAYDKMENAGELGLRGRGLVLLGNGKPIVLSLTGWALPTKGRTLLKKLWQKQQLQISTGWWYIPCINTMPRISVEIGHSEMVGGGTYLASTRCPGL